MAEEVKRLKPTPDTLRELYLKSGNQCAFPGCNELIIDKNGVFIGEVCHIEAAKTGGERFNEEQSNDDRRKFSNLMLMCHKHHKVTDDVEKYTVDVLKKMKEEHEKKFTNIEQKIGDSIKDYCEEDNILLPKTLSGMNEYFGWGQTQEDLNYTINCIREFAEILKKIPYETRKIFSIICKRVEKEKILGGVTKFKVLPSEIQKACKLDFNNLRENLRILEKYKMCFLENDFDEGEYIYLNREPYDGGWIDIYDYFNDKNINIEKMIVGLDFTVLD